MTDSRWALTDRLYHAALEREGRDRDAFLAEACEGDEDLRRDLASLLEYDRPAGAFLERPALEEAARTLAVDAAVSMEGREMGDYLVLAPLGAGGMGEVHRATDRRLRRDVALKLVSRVLAGDPGYAQRFEHEARSASALNHPNIVTIYGVGADGETAYIAMELVEGRTLREVLATGPLPAITALDLGVQLADAIAAAHAAGIVHRDLKPDNVMVTASGLLKVLDFGIARRERDSHTAGTIVGTVGYMSPEQASGEPAGPASDQFAFAAILSEMLTSSARPRSAGARSVPAGPAAAGLRELIHRGLQQEPRDRFRSMEDVAVELRRLRAVAAEPRRLLGLTRRQAMLGGMAAVALALATAAAQVARRPRPPNPESEALYRRALQAHREDTEAGFRSARELLRTAVAIDPEFAAAHAALSATYSVMAIDGYENPIEAWPQASRSFRRARNLAPDLPEAHAEFASYLFFYNWDAHGAAEEWEAALAGGDTLPDFMIAYALERWATGHADQAVDLARRARIRAAGSRLFTLREADFLLHAAQLERAAAVYGNLIRADADEAAPYLGLAEVRRREGRYDAAIEALGQAHELFGDRALVSLADEARGREGYQAIERAMARRQLEALEAREAERGYVSPLDFASTYARLGDERRCLGYFPRALDEKAPGLVFLTVDPVWDAVRDAPVFRAAVEKVRIAR